jgi:hypothetical protein
MHQAGGPGTVDHGLDWGAVVFGIILLGIGGWFLLKDTFGVDLPNIAWSQFWPVILIVIGVLVLIRSATGGGRRGRRLDR